MRPPNPSCGLWKRNIATDHLSTDKERAVRAYILWIPLKIIYTFWQMPYNVSHIQWERPIQELVCTMQNYISKKWVTCSQAYHEHIVYTRIQIQLHPIPNPTINQNYIIHLCKMERTAIFMTLSIFPDRKNSSLEINQTSVFSSSKLGWTFLYRISTYILKYLSKAQYILQLKCAIWYYK